MSSDLNKIEFSIQLYGKIMGRTSSLELAKKFANSLGKNAIIFRDRIAIN